MIDRLTLEFLKLSGCVWIFMLRGFCCAFLTVAETDRIPLDYRFAWICYEMTKFAIELEEEE